MIIKLYGITEKKALHISSTLGLSLKYAEEAGDNLYNMQLPDTYVNVNIKQEWITIHRSNGAMHIKDDEFYKLEVL